MKYAILIIVLVVCAAMVAKQIAHYKRPGVTAAACAVSGAGALFAANALGCGIAVNAVSAACSAVLGIPGVLMMALLGKCF